MDTLHTLYQDIARRTAGDIYIGVVGPARTGKSTFIQRFMETLVLPGIPEGAKRDRARDELPQSGSGRTVMTAEPKFVPEDAAQVALEGGGVCSLRLVDCVGYMVPGAEGQTEDDLPRMVRTPWFPQEIPMAEAAEIGTRKVITEHATIGLVVTSDGTVTDLPRSAYAEAEERVVTELKALGKPFLVLLNSAAPRSPETQALRGALAEKYDVTCLAVRCPDLDREEITDILTSVLYEFPLVELDLFLPPWVDALPPDHPIRADLFRAVREAMGGLRRLRDVKGAVEQIGTCPRLSAAAVTAMRLGEGVCAARLDLPREAFYETLSRQTGFSIPDDGALFRLLADLGARQDEYRRVSAALEEVRSTGYGVVLPGSEELTLAQPELLRQGGRYGVRLRATAPSIHLIRADIQAEVAPIVGSEKQSEDMLDFLLSEYEAHPERIWQSNLFGRSFQELVGEDLGGKLRNLPEDARGKLRLTLEKILNEGSGGLICIIL